MSFFKKITNKLAKQEQTNTVQPVLKEENKKAQTFDFVEEYTLANPKKLIVDVNAWALCKKVPVACENGIEKSGWHKCVELNTSVMLPFINALNASSNEDIAPKAMRTISVVHITKDVDIYILPILPICKREEKCWFNWVDNTRQNPNHSFPRGWFFHMTPDIRKAIAAQVKVYQ